MTPDIQELKAKALAAKERYSGKWQAIEGAGKLSDENHQLIADIRGWGYLTGKGAGGLGLTESEAIQIQRNMLAYLAAACPSAILALIEIAEAAEIVHRETMAREYADRELLVSALARLRTALEGVKK